MHWNFLLVCRWATFKNVSSPWNNLRKNRRGLEWKSLQNQVHFLVMMMHMIMASDIELKYCRCRFRKQNTKKLQKKKKIKTKELSRFERIRTRNLRGRDTSSIAIEARDNKKVMYFVFFFLFVGHDFWNYIQNYLFKSVNFNFKI